MVPMCMVNEETLNQTAFGAGLVGDEGHAEDFFGLFTALDRICSEFDATTLAASAGMDLGFNDHTAAELFCCLNGLVNRESHYAFWHRDSVFGQDFLGLMLMDFHWICPMLGTAGILQLIMPFLDHLHKVCARKGLTRDEARDAMNLILHGEVSTPLSRDSGALCQ